MAFPSKTMRDMDANTLFENHSIEEVRGIERKLRHEIEWKKEEMRDLVGERYRDLISAADTIKKMKECAEKVGQTLTDMNTHCQRLRDAHKVKGAMLNGPAVSKLQANEKTMIYEVACEIKLLLAVPGKIWHYLDTCSYLPAAQLYLLSKHIHGSLQYDTQTGGQVLARFPVIARQWAAISHFKAAILQGCKVTLSDYSKPTQDIADALCTILILEDKTPRQVFQDFLILRMYTGKGSTAVRNHIRNAVKLIHNTVYQISAIFSQTREGSILSTAIANLLEKPIIDQLGIEEFLSLKKHLPKSVVTYMPTLRIQNVSLTEEYLKSSCDKWMSSCLDNVRTNVSEQLSYVSTIRNLTSVRDTVWEIFTQDERLDNWTTVSEALLSEPINLWSDVLASMFSLRVEQLISQHFTKLISTTENKLLESKVEIHNSQARSQMLKYESDIGGYIWTEAASDLPANNSWLPSTAKTFQDGGCLLLKAHGFTPLVQSLCKQLNSGLSALLTDVEKYKEINVEDTGAVLLQGCKENISSSTSKFCKEGCYEAINSLMNVITRELDACREELDKQYGGSENVTERAPCCWLLVLARFSAAAPQLCHVMEKCITMSNSAQIDAMSRRSMMRSISKPAPDPLWTQTSSLLTDTAYNCYRLLLKVLGDEAVRDFQTQMSRSDLPSQLSLITRWDEIEIDEDGEDGSIVKSTISVPMQVRACVHICLYRLCKEINKIGSHSLDGSLVKELVASTVFRLLGIYQESLTAQSVTQTTALQNLFDIWFLTGLLDWKNTEKSPKISQLTQSLIDDLQSRIDPFDLDVFTPYMQKHVNRQKSRSLVSHQAASGKCFDAENLVLFGAIANTDHLMSNTSRLTQAGRQEQHNVLALYTSSHTRFPLLPVVSEQAKSTLAQAITPAEKKMIDNSVIKNIQSEPALKTSGSFYDRIGAMSWFSGNK